MTPIPSVMRTGNMYTSTFTFAKRQYDAEFYALDDVIAQITKSIPGYLGERLGKINKPDSSQMCTTGSPWLHCNH